MGGRRITRSANAVLFPVTTLSAAEAPREEEEEEEDPSAKDSSNRPRRAGGRRLFPSESDAETKAETSTRAAKKRTRSGSSADPSAASTTVAPSTRTRRSFSKTAPVPVTPDAAVAEEEEEEKVLPPKKPRRSSPRRTKSQPTITSYEDGAAEPKNKSSKSNDSKTSNSATTTTTTTTTTTVVTPKTERKAAAASKKKKNPPKKKKKKTLPTWPEPEGWRDTYELVRELRRDKTAPCDFMGAEALALPPDDDDAAAGVSREERAKIRRFQTLVALMLSSQTKDAVVSQAMRNLRDPSDDDGGLTVRSMLDIDPASLNRKIYSVGFRNNKTKYIRQVAEILHAEYDDDVPPTAQEMIDNLPGVGPKMAYIVENICWDRQSGIGVDTHMQRLFPKLRWVSPTVKNPEQTRRQLESWLPKEHWGEVNLLWVGFGQEVQQERSKILRKALRSSRPSDALRLLKTVDFDVYTEWTKLEAAAAAAEENAGSDDVDDEPTTATADRIIPWKDQDEKERMMDLVEQVCRRKLR